MGSAVEFMRSDEGIQEGEGFLRFERRIKRKQTSPRFLRGRKIATLRLKIKISEVRGNVRWKKFVDDSYGIDAGAVAEREDLIFVDDVGRKDFLQCRQSIRGITGANIKIGELPIDIR